MTIYCVFFTEHTNILYQIHIIIIKQYLNHKFLKLTQYRKYLFWEQRMRLLLNKFHSKNNMNYLANLHGLMYFFSHAHILLSSLQLDSNYRSSTGVGETDFALWNKRFDTSGYQSKWWYFDHFTNINWMIYLVICFIAFDLFTKKQIHRIYTTFYQNEFVLVIFILF